MRAVLILVALMLPLVAAQAQRHSGDEPAMCDKVMLTAEVKIADQREGPNHGDYFR